MQERNSSVMDSAIIKTGNNSRCDGIPACFFDTTIFNYLDNHKNFTLEGRRQQHHSVTLFPKDKTDGKINMPSYTLGQKQPFVYQGGPTDNKFIGFAVKLDNRTKLKEASKVNAMTCLGCGIKQDCYVGRSNCVLSLRKPIDGIENNQDFFKDMLQTYGDMADFMEGKSTKLRGKSPLEQHNHPNGIKSLNNSYIMNLGRQRNIPTAEMTSTRISYDDINKKITYPYCELAIEDNYLESKFIILDGRKRVSLSLDQKKDLFNKIKDYNKIKNIKGICAYAIDEDNVIKPFDEKGIEQILDAICSSKGRCKDVPPYQGQLSTIDKTNKKTANYNKKQNGTTFDSYKYGKKLKEGYSNVFMSTFEQQQNCNIF